VSERKLFRTLNYVRCTLAAWRVEYNCELDGPRDQYTRTDCEMGGAAVAKDVNPTRRAGLKVPGKNTLASTFPGAGGPGVGRQVAQRRIITWLRTPYCRPSHPFEKQTA